MPDYEFAMGYGKNTSLYDIQNLQKFEKFRLGSF